MRQLLDYWSRSEKVSMFLLWFIETSGKLLRNLRVACSRVDPMFRWLVLFCMFRFFLFQLHRVVFLQLVGFTFLILVYKSGVIFIILNNLPFTNVTISKKKQQYQWICFFSNLASKYMNNVNFIIIHSAWDQFTILISTCLTDVELEST